MEQDKKTRNKSMHLWSTNDRGGKNIQWRKDRFFNNWCQENQTAACKRMKLEHSLRSCTKINSKWIKYLNVNLDTIKLLEEKQTRTFFDINLSHIFLDPPLRVTKTKTNVNKWNLIKLKRLCIAMESINETKRQLRMGKKYLQSD